MKVNPVVAIVLILIGFLVLREVFGDSDEEKKETKEKPDPGSGFTSAELQAALDALGAGDTSDYDGGDLGGGGDKPPVELNKNDAAAVDLINDYMLVLLDVHSNDINGWIRGFGLGKNLYEEFNEYEGKNAGREALDYAGIRSLEPTDHLFFTAQTNPDWFNQLNVLNGMKINGQEYKGSGFANNFVKVIGGVLGNVLTSLKAKKNFSNNTEYRDIFAAFDNFSKYGGTSFLPPYKWIEDNWVYAKSGYGRNYLKNAKDRNKINYILADAADLRDRINDEVLKLNAELQQQAIDGLNRLGKVKIT